MEIIERINEMNKRHSDICADFPPIYIKQKNGYTAYCVQDKETIEIQYSQYAIYKNGFVHYLNRYTNNKRTRMVYDKELNCLMVNLVNIHVKNATEIEVEFDTSPDLNEQLIYYFFDGKNIPYDIHGCIVDKKTYIESKILKHYCNRNSYFQKISDYIWDEKGALRDFLGRDELASTIGYKIDTTARYCFGRWTAINYEQNHRSNSKNLLSELIKLTPDYIPTQEDKLKAIMMFNDWMRPELSKKAIYRHWYGYNTLAKYLEINKDWCCFLCYHLHTTVDKNDEIKLYNDNCYESYRIYISNKDTKNIIIASPIDDNKTEWHLETKTGSGSIAVINTEEALTFGRLKYLKDIWMSDEKTALSHNIIAVLRHPILEKLYKAGGKDIVLRVLKEPNPMSELTYLFGDEIKENKTIGLYNAIGFNNRQVIKINTIVSKCDDGRYSEEYNQIRAIRMIKSIIGNKSAQSITDEQFDKYIQIAAGAIGASYGRYDWNSIMDQIVPESIINKLSWCEKLYNLGQSADRNLFQIASDTLSLYKRLHYYHSRHEDVRVPNINWEDLRYVEDFTRVHDQIVELHSIANRQYGYRYSYSKEPQEEQIKKYADTKKEREYLNYSNEKYEIRLPNDLAEIVEEGCSLHHCVAGYVGPHAEGHTTIMFLRQKACPNTSWFTLEIKNGCLIQIHGLCNKWLSCDEDGYEAVPTVIDWLTLHDIKYDPKVLLSQAARYSESNPQYREMPVRA